MGIFLKGTPDSAGQAVPYVRAVNSIFTSIISFTAVLDQRSFSRYRVENLCPDNNR